MPLQHHELLSRVKNIIMKFQHNGTVYKVCTAIPVTNGITGENTAIDVVNGI